MILFINDILSMSVYSLVPTRFLQFLMLMIILTMLHYALTFNKANLLQRKEITFTL